VQNIVKLCGNKLRPTGASIEIGAIGTQRRMEEVFVKQKFAKTVMDPRSFAKTLENCSLTLGQYYRICGLNSFPASGVAGEFSVPIVNDWFKIDWNKLNPFTGESGFSGVYVFRNLTNFIYEISNWIYEEHQSRSADESKNPKETPRKKDDHLMTTLLYLAGIPPRYIEGASVIDDEEEEYEEDKRNREIKRDKYTGY
jgi:hypothetical protein